jgi:hypothetical protein
MGVCDVMLTPRIGAGMVAAATGQSCKSIDSRLTRAGVGEGGSASTATSSSGRDGGCKYPKAGRGDVAVVQACWEDLPDVWVCCRMHALLRCVVQYSNSKLS